MPSTSIVRDPSGTERHYEDGRLVRYLDIFSLLHHYDRYGAEYKVVDTAGGDVWNYNRFGRLVMTFSPCPWKLGRVS